LVLLLLLFPVQSWADTHAAASCSQAHVQAAVDASTAGDLVTVPSGSCAWGTTVTITKGITLQGAGDSTVISGTASPLIDIIAPGSGNFRVTALKLTGARGLDVKINGGSTSMRVDHITWQTGSTKAIWIGQDDIFNYFWINGTLPTSQKVLIDSINYTSSVTPSQFLHIFGRQHKAWQEADGFGSDNFVFLEDSTFNWSSGTNTLTDTEYAGRLVVRHCNITNGSIGTHDLGGGTVNPSRGHRAGEYYNNTVRSTDNPWSHFTFTRGGSALAYNNTLSGAQVTQWPEIFRVAYNSWAGGGGFCGENAPLKRCNDVVRHSTVTHKPCYTESATCVFTCSSNADCLDFNGDQGICMTVDGTGSPSGYPCRDQTGRGQEDSSAVQSLIPSYWWSNTVSGVPNSGTGGMGSYAAYIVLNRDYCEHSPATDCGAKSAWTYTPYTFPHPLRGEGDPDTTAPVMSALSPSAKLSCTSDPRDVTLSLTTDELATCKGSPTDEAYASMDWTFDGTGTTSHTKTLSLACDATYTYYVRCQDDEAIPNVNLSSAILSFAIDPASGDTTPPTLSTSTLAADGRTLTLAFNEAVNLGNPGRGIVAPLVVNTSNTRYFNDGSGKAIYLTGSHTWDIFQVWSDQSSVSTTEYINFLKLYGHNFVRLWVNTSQIGDVLPLPWTGTSPNVDLTSFNQTYFDALAVIVAQFQSEGIYVSIMLFGTGNTMRNSWTSSAWNPLNNNNAAMNVLSTSDGDTFYSTNSGVLDIQKLLVAKTIDTLNAYDNIVAWEIINEGEMPTSNTWQEAMVTYARAYESGKAKQHLVFRSSGGWGGEEDTLLYSGGADIISPGNVTDNYKAGGPASYSSKPIIVDTDHLWGFSAPDYGTDGTYADWVWKVFTRGKMPIFMDSYKTDFDEGGTPAQYNDGTLMSEFTTVRAAMGHTLIYAKKMGLVNMAPSESISSTTYALYNAGQEYLVYQPSSGAFTVTMVAGAYYYEWFNPTTGFATTTGTYTATTGSNAFNTSTPGYYPAVLYFKKSPDNWTLGTTGEAVTISYTSGGYSSRLIYTTSRVILPTETLTVSYVPPTTNVTEDNAGNDLAAISNQAATNNSTQGAIIGDARNIWEESAMNGTDFGDGRALELGVKFQSSVAGVITGIKFYKQAANTGTHVGNLWTVTGTNLGTVDFTGESASGWQTMSFATPLHINAATTYIASVFMPSGYLTSTTNYFLTNGVTNAPLSSPVSAAGDPNGVYKYTATTAFPNAGGSRNYWVDIVFAQRQILNVSPPTGLGIISFTGSQTLSW